MIDPRLAAEVEALAASWGADRLRRLLERLHEADKRMHQSQAGGTLPLRITWHEGRLAEVRWQPDERIA